MNTEENRLKLFNAISKVPKYFLIEMLENLKNAGYVQDFNRESPRHVLAELLADVILRYRLTQQFKELLQYNGYTFASLPYKVESYLKDLVFRNYNNEEIDQELKKLKYYGILDVIPHPIDKYQKVDLIIESAPIVMNLIPDKFPRLMELLMKAKGIINVPMERLNDAQRYLESYKMYVLRDLLMQLSRDNDVVYSPGRTKKGIVNDIIDHLFVDKYIPSDKIILETIDILKGNKNLNYLKYNVVPPGSLPMPISSPRR